MNTKKDIKQNEKTTFIHIAIAIFIVLGEALWSLFKKIVHMGKTPKAQEIRKVEEIQVTKEEETKKNQKSKKAKRVRKEYKSFKLPVLLKGRISPAYIMIAILITCGSIYALLSDKVIAETSLQAGTVLVKLDEDAPFDDLESIGEEGAQTNEKTFRAISICTLDTYVRARIIPVIEMYDETEECYVVLPIHVDDIKLEINAPYWTYSDGYYYYSEALEPSAISEDFTVSILSIENSIEYKDTDVRITLRVELEAAQTRNDVWKQVFGITSLPL